jgi:dihydrofolate reductase
MTRVIADISVSLDGFVTGPGPGPDNGLGTGGEAPHTWAFSDDPEDRRVLREGTARSGAGEVGKPAFVVVTSSPPESVRLTDLGWTFVTTGLPDAVTAARERAGAASSDSGKELDVVLMGGGATIGSALDAGLVDTLSLHLAPVVLGTETPLFTGRAPRTLIPIDAVTGWGVLAPGPRSGPVPARTAPGTSPAAQEFGFWLKFCGPVAERYW